MKVITDRREQGRRKFEIRVKYLLIPVCWAGRDNQGDGKDVLQIIGCSCTSRNTYVLYNVRNGSFLDRSLNETNER